MGKAIHIDRRKRLADEPKTGHNRWHPDIAPIVEVDEGEDVALETRDAADGYLTSSSTAADFPSLPLGVIHPLTGPVSVKGARPGDLLEVEFIDIVPQRWAFTAIMPGLGFLRDVMTTPFLVHWTIADGWATSPQLPGVRIPGAPFMGVSGVAPSRQQLEAWTRREADLAARKGFALPPDPSGAVPASGPVATHGVRTLPPRENGGNFDVKQLTRGAKLLLPVAVEGALFSTGDGHFAQGDGGSLRDGGGDGRRVRGALSRAARRGRAAQDPLAAIPAERLLHRSAVGGTPAVHRHHGHARDGDGGQRG
jgi:formamidase